MLFIDKILTTLTFTFFGIEDSIWQQIDDSEKLKFRAMTFTIALISIITFFGMFEFFMLLINQFYFAVIFSLLITIIIVNIIRFSIFTIQKPIYFENENVTTPKVESCVGQLSTKVFGSLKNVWNKFICNFSIELFVRIIINGILLLFIAFPFACFLSANTINQINNNKRIELIENFKKSEETKYRLKLDKLDSKINLIENKIKASGSTLFNSELKKEINIRKQFNEEWENVRKSNIDQFVNQISSKNFIILSYKSITNQISFILTVSILGLLLFLSHFQKHKLVNTITYKYYTLANKYFHELALQNYKNAESSIRKELSKKYSNKVVYNKLIENYDKIIANSPYVNPPFNSIQKEIKSPVNQMTKAEFIKHYG
ncbi:hypothetical protein [Flavobacterium sp.]|jgi:hypothetical protein|uniref:hypothetical protein n=1 Tax=Flavobacterium sp. TaxID=239 RepID=UPI0037BFFEA0